MTGVKLVVSDAHEGLKAAVTKPEFAVARQTAGICTLNQGVTQNRLVACL
jgi:hypothetical protein